MTTSDVPVIFIILGYAFASALMMAILNHLGSISWRRSSHMHWSERARLLWPARCAARSNIFLITGCAFLAASPHGEWQHIWPWFVVAGFIGALLGCYPLDHQIKRDLTFKAWLYQCLVGWGSIIIRWGPLIVVACYLPHRWKWELAPVVVLCAGWYLWIVTAGYVSVLRFLRALTPLPSEFANSLRPSFEKAQVFPKQLWMIRTPYPNAFALPVGHGLMFSEGLLRNCSAEQLCAVCSHELAHLTEGQSALVKRIIVSFALFPYIFIKPVMGSWGPIGLLAILIWCVLCIAFARRLGRRFEVRADSAAAAQEENKGIYASALETIYRLNQVPAVMAGKGKAHPHLYDRMLAAGVTPDFPRPKAPEATNWTICVPIALGIAILVMRWM